MFLDTFGTSVSLRPNNSAIENEAVLNHLRLAGYAFEGGTHQTGIEWFQQIARESRNSISANGIIIRML